MDKVTPPNNYQVIIIDYYVHTITCIIVNTINDDSDTLSDVEPSKVDDPLGATGNDEITGINDEEDSKDGADTEYEDHDDEDLGPT